MKTRLVKIGGNTNPCPVCGQDGFRWYDGSYRAEPAYDEKLMWSGKVRPHPYKKDK